MNDAQVTLALILRKVSGTPLTITNLTNFGNLGVTVDDVEVTDFNSNGFKEFMPGLKDAGEVPFEAYVKSESNFTSVRALQNGAVHAFELEFENGAVFFFSAYVKEVKHKENTVGSARAYTGILRISGEVVYASSGISA